MYEGNGPHPIRMPESLTFFVSLPSCWRQQPQQYPHRTALHPRVCAVGCAPTAEWHTIHLVLSVCSFLFLSWFPATNYSTVEPRELCWLCVCISFLVFGGIWVATFALYMHHPNNMHRIAAAAAATDPFQQLVRSATFHIPPPSWLESEPKSVQFRTKTGKLTSS
jgi:hypothetical protein